MPLGNMFLWIMLILAGLLSYQLLASLKRAESRAARAMRLDGPAHDGIHARNGTAISYSRKAAADSYRQFSPANSGRRSSQPGFLTIASSQDMNSSKFNEISFFLPNAGPHSDQISKQKMAVDSDCHHCA